MTRFILLLFGSIACSPEAPVSTPGVPTEPSPCFELTQSIVNFGTVDLNEPHDPIEVHLESRCPELSATIELDDPDKQFQISQPERIGNQWYFDIFVQPRTVGEFEAQVTVFDVQTQRDRGRIQVFANIVDEAP